MERRELLRSVGGVAALTLFAGCSSVTGPGPEATAEEYIQALSEDDEETYESLLHPEVSFLPIGVGGEGLTVNTVEQRDVEAYLSQSGEPTDSEIDTFEQDIQEEIDEIGADGYALVYYDIEYEQWRDVTGYSTDGYLMLVQSDGEWLIYA